MKRKATFSKFSGDMKQYIEDLLKITQVIPTDPEVWAELGEAYYTAGHYTEAIHALQEVLILTPHAYNMFARIGEIHHTYVSRNTSLPFNEKFDNLALAVKHFLRAVELCPVYVRGWAGVQVSSHEILKLPEAATKLEESEKSRYSDLTEVSERRLLYIVSEKQGTPENLAAANAILTEY